MLDLSAAAQAKVSRLRRRTADLCLVVLSTAVWAGATLLASLGCLLLIGILVADGHVSRFFLHARNLADHYLVATPAARLKFQYELAGLFGGITASLSIARWPGFLRRLQRDLARGTGRD